MTDAFICDAIRPLIGKLNGALAAIRADDLAAIPLQPLMARNPGADWARMDDVVLGCANQAGEHSLNVARMAALLAGLTQTVPGGTLSQLCGAGVDAVRTWRGRSGLAMPT